jgi:hypothetical protein
MPCIGRQLPEKSIITAALLRVVWCKTKLIRGRVAVLQYESPPHCPIHTIFIRPGEERGERAAIWTASVGTDQYVRPLNRDAFDIHFDDRPVIHRCQNVEPFFADEDRVGRHRLLN